MNIKGAVRLLSSQSLWAALIGTVSDTDNALFIRPSSATWGYVM